MAAFKVPAETILDVAEALNADNLNAVFSHVCALRDMALADPSGSIEREILEHLTSMRHAPADAILLGWAALSEDRVQVRRIHREVTLHGNPMPSWLTAFPHAKITRAFTVKVGDDDRLSIMFEAVADDCTFVMSALIHFPSMGVMEDGYLLQGTIEEVLEPLQRDAGSSVEIAQVDEVKAKTSLEEAIAWAELHSPRLDTETWPLLQPVFTKLLATVPDVDVNNEDAWENRFLPGYLWNFEEAEDLIIRFWETVDPRDWLPGTRWLIERIAYTTSDFSQAEHKRWPEEFVERLFTRDLVHGGLAEPEDYAEFPRLFERYIRFLVSEGFTSASNAEVVLAVVSRHKDTLVTNALQLLKLASAGELDARTLFGRWRYLDAMCEEVVTQAGYERDPDKLDTAPFPPPEVSVWGIRETIKQVVGDAGALLVVSGEPLFKVPDMNAVMWHLLKHLAGEDPERFGRFAPGTVAAAVAWIAGQNNGLVGRGQVTQQQIADHFGVTVQFMRCANRFRDVLFPTDRAWVFPSGAWFLLASEKRQRLVIRYRQLLQARDDVEAAIKDAQHRQQERENRQGPEGS